MWGDRNCSTLTLFIQHGFKSLHSTSTLLTTVSQSVFEGLNHGKPALRSLVAAIDISKVFDTVPWYKLVSKILDTQLQPNYKRWLYNFIARRQGPISYGGVMSKHRQLPNGVPQGAVLSPSLSLTSSHMTCRYLQIQQLKYTLTLTI